jgi:hypothetical protein
MKGTWYVAGRSSRLRGSVVVPENRIYRLSPAEKIVGPPTEVVCASDQEAATEAQKLLNGLDVEVWQGARVVRQFAPSRFSGAGEQ